MATTVEDPLGNKVLIQQEPPGFDARSIETGEIMDDITRVIEKPAMLFRMYSGSIDLYYFRVIGWEKTILVGVQKTGDVYKISDCELDLSTKRLAELLKNGERLL